MLSFLLTSVWAIELGVGAGPTRAIFSFKNKKRICPIFPIKCDSTCSSVCVDATDFASCVSTGEFIRGNNPGRAGTGAALNLQGLGDMYFKNSVAKRQMTEEAVYGTQPGYEFPQGLGYPPFDFNNICPTTSNSFRIDDAQFTFGGQYDFCDETKNLCAAQQTTGQFDFDITNGAGVSTCLDTVYESPLQQGFTGWIKETTNRNDFWVEDTEGGSGAWLSSKANGLRNYELGYSADGGKYTIICKEGAQFCSEVDVDDGTCNRYPASIPATESCNRIQQYHFFNRRRYVIFRVCKVDDHTLDYVAGATFSVSCELPDGTSYYTDTLTVGSSQNIVASEQYGSRSGDKDFGCTKCLKPIPWGSKCTFTEQSPPKLWCNNPYPTKEEDATASYLQNYFFCDSSYTPIDLFEYDAKCPNPTNVKEVQFENKMREVCAYLVKCADKPECQVASDSARPYCLREGERQVAMPDGTVVSETVSCRVPGVGFELRCWSPNWEQYTDAYKRLVERDATFPDIDADGITKEEEYEVDESDPPLEIPVVWTDDEDFLKLQLTSNDGEVNFGNLPFGSRCIVREYEVPDQYKPLGYRFWTNRLGPCDVCENDYICPLPSSPDVFKAGCTDPSFTSVSLSEISAVERVGALFDRVIFT